MERCSPNVPKSGRARGGYRRATGERPPGVLHNIETFHLLCLGRVVVFLVVFFFKESQTVSGNVNLIAYMIRLIKM